MAKKKSEMDRVLEKYDVTRKGKIIPGARFGEIAGRTINLENLDLKTADHLYKNGSPFLKEKKAAAE